MPHITIKHFPLKITEEIKLEISRAVTDLISEKLKCSKEVISISMIEIEKDEWTKKVYIPEITEMHSYLIKQPNY